MDLKSILGSIAPILGSAIGGPLGGLAVKAAADALGLSDATEEALTQAVSGAKPEQILALRQADQAFEVRLRELGIEADKVLIQDRQNARARDVEFVKSGRNNVRGDVLAYGALGALIATLVLLFIVRVPQESREILLVVLGALVAIVKDCYSFEFGSSKDSARNAQAVSDALKAQA